MALGRERWCWEVAGRGQGLFLKRRRGVKPSAEQGEGPRATGILASCTPEREKDLGEAGVGQGSTQEVLLSSLRSCRNNVLFSWPGLNVSPVLVSPGVELILFLVAGAVLCFGFSLRIMVIF